MFAFPIEINIKEVNTGSARKRAAAVEIIANNLDMEALEILSKKCKKPGMSKKVKQFKHMM